MSIDKTQLTPKQAEALDLQHQGFTYRQMADCLGITPEAVSYRLMRARRNITRSKAHQSSISKCAKESCSNLLYTENAITLDSRIGRVIVYLCAEHLAEYLHTNIASQSYNQQKDNKNHEGI